MLQVTLLFMNILSKTKCVIFVYLTVSFDSKVYPFQQLSELTVAELVHFK